MKRQCSKHHLGHGEEMRLVESALTTQGHFAQRRDGVVVRGRPWGACILMATLFIDAVTRGDTLNGAVIVSGHAEPDGTSVFDSITFACSNGTATYDLDPPDDDDLTMGTRSGTLRSGSWTYEEDTST